MRTEDRDTFAALLRNMAKGLGSLLRDAETALAILQARGELRGPARRDEGLYQQLIDEDRFTVRWNGRECRLGNTVLFRLLRCLVASVNRYVTHEDLLDVAWGAHRKPSTIRTAVCVLRERLSSSGMSELAAALDGETTGHYALRLDPATVRRRPDEKPT